VSDEIFIGIPVLNRFDLLAECVRRIDVPHRLLCINNNTVDAAFQEQLKELKTKYPCLAVEDAPRNLGVSASWNHLVRAGFAAGFERVFITANDFHVEHGSWAAFRDTVLRVPAELYLGDGYNLFCVTRALIDHVGYFDENYFPAYMEDVDYDYRCRLADVAVVRFGIVPGTFGQHELPGLQWRHHGSQTIRSDLEYGKRNEWTHFTWNRTHYELKWGGLPPKEKFKIPYNKPEHDLRWWPPPAGSIEHRDWDQNRKRVR
jgi:hypothetical protein